MVARPSAISWSTAGATCSGANRGEARQRGKIEKGIGHGSLRAALTIPRSRGGSVRPPTSVRTTRPVSSSPGTACSCPGLRAPPASTTQARAGSKRQMSAGAPAASVPAAHAQHARRAIGDRARAPAARARPASRPPLERERQEELEARRAGLGFGERHLLRVVVHRRVVRAHRVDDAVGEPAAQRVAVAGIAQRRATGCNARRSRRCRGRTDAGGARPRRR